MTEGQFKNIFLRTILLADSLLALVAAGRPNPAWAAEQAQVLGKDTFHLSVTLQDIYNQNFSIVTDVTTDKPFKVIKINGPVKNTVSGILHRPRDNQYPLTLTISEWKSKESNIKDIQDLNLALDEPWSGGPVSSFVYMRTVVLSQSHSPPGGFSAATPKTLENEIYQVHLTTSVEAFRAGGATMDDAVQLLRQRTALPICFESLDYDRDNKDKLTLGDVLDGFRDLGIKNGLTAEDEGRLKMYEEMATHQSTATLVGVKEKMFTLVRDHMTVRAVLDRITQLDSAYAWKNNGTDKTPLIIIQPRTSTVLGWPVPRICGMPRETSSDILYGPKGKLAQLFADHHITGPVEMHTGPASLGDKGRPDLPNVSVDLCQDHLSAEDVLNRTVKAAGSGFSWSLSGIKGLRFLSFQKNLTVENSTKIDFDEAQKIAGNVSISDLIANPVQYDGKEVQVVGFVHLDKPPLYEEWSDSICPGDKKVPSKDCLNLMLPDNFPQRKSFKDGYSRVKGKFRKSHGHRGLWGGSLSDVMLFVQIQT